MLKNLPTRSKRLSLSKISFIDTDYDSAGSRSGEIKTDATKFGYR